MPLCRTLIIISVTFLSGLSAFSTVSHSYLLSLEVELRHFISSQNIPKLQVAAPKTITVVSKPLPSEVVETFNQVQGIVFKNAQILNLSACDGCAATADASTMTVYLDPTFLETIKGDYQSDSNQIIKLIVAHEISHFIFEFIALNSEKGLSPNGNIPLITKSFFDFTNREKLLKLSMEDQLREVNNYTSRVSQSHSEVDAIAILLLRKLGIDVVEQAKRYFSALILKETGPAKRDFEVRREAVETYFPLN